MTRTRKAGRLNPALGWIGAAGVVAGAHVAIALAFAARPPERLPGDATPAILIDLQPIAVPPAPPPPPEVAPEVAQEPPQAQPEPPPPPVAQEPVKEPPPEVTPPVEPPPPPQPEVTPTPAPPPEPVPEIKPPEVPVKAEAVLPPPAPQTPPKEPPKPVEHKPKREIVHREPKRPERTAVPQPAAPPPATPQPSAAAVQSARAEWQRAMQSHIARFKRSASGAGRATVTFTISRDGQVVSARLASSSGKADLDTEAVAMVERASPMPAPPPEFPGRTITLTIPIIYR